MANASDLFLFDLLPLRRSPPEIPFAGALDLYGGSRASDAPPFDEIAPLQGISRLGLGFERDGDGGRADRESDWAADDFFVGRRMSSAHSSVEFSRACPVDSEGLRVVGLDWDSDSEDQQIVAIGGGIEEGGEGPDRAGPAGGVGLPLRWDCLQFGDGRRDPSDEFEWEEVDARVEERDAISVTIIGDEVRSEEIRELDYDDGDDDDGGGSRDVDWEVLLSVNSLGRNPMDPEDVEAYFVDEQEGFADASDNEAYEVLVGQFADHESSIKGSPPAAKSVIDSLPSVLLTKEDAAKADAVCAVCKDGISVEERVKRLPCSHLYHKECILPWLAIRNSCPLCRFELPTDDPEYEKWKARRAAPAVPEEEESQLRYDFEVLPEP